MESFGTHSITALSTHTHTHTHRSPWAHFKVRPHAKASGPADNNYNCKLKVVVSLYKNAFLTLLLFVFPLLQYSVCRYWGLHQPGVPMHSPGAGHDAQWTLCPIRQAGVGKKAGRRSAASCFVSNLKLSGWVKRLSLFVLYKNEKQFLCHFVIWDFLSFQDK